MRSEVVAHSWGQNLRLCPLFVPTTVIGLFWAQGKKTLQNNNKQRCRKTDVTDCKSAYPGSIPGVASIARLSNPINTDLLHATDAQRAVRVGTKVGTRSEGGATALDVRAPTQLNQRKGSRTMQLHLVDGSAYIHRMFHAMPALSRPSDDMPVGALAGVAGALLDILQGVSRSEHATHLAVIFDASRNTFRKEIYPDYKANRSAMHPDLAVQMPHMRRLVDAFGIERYELPGYEADDIIATYARMAEEQGGSVVIHSSDKDLLQLVTDRVQCYCPVKKELRGYAECIAKLGVPPDMVIDYQALVGDPVDNVPGVKQIGPKAAEKLLQRYGTLEDVLFAAQDPESELPGCNKTARANLADKDQADLALISRELVTLKDDVPVDCPLDTFKVRPLNRGKTREFFKEMAFSALTERVFGEPLAA